MTDEPFFCLPKPVDTPPVHRYTYATFVTGLHKALRAPPQARGDPHQCFSEAHGMGLLGSGLTETGVGFAASVHLFASLDILLPPELNGVQFLEKMWVHCLEIDGANVTVPDAPGLGVVVDEEEIRRHAFEV